MTEYEILLEVQDHDSAIDRLRHRAATLPERTELAAVEERMADRRTRLDDVAGRRDEIARRQSRMEDEVAALDSKITDVEKRLYSGAVSAPRELQALQADVESLRRHRSAVEDSILEAMEEREPLDDEVATLEAEQVTLDAETSRLLTAIAETEAAIDAEVKVEEERRAEQAAGIPADLLTLYEELRQRLDGVGAARLTDGRCQGCHLTLPATEVARIKREPPDTLLRCDQCSRILVRS